MTVTSAIYGGRYRVCGTRMVDGGLLFWVERVGGQGVWQHISHAGVPAGLDPATEFVAATEGGANSLAEGIALRSGWFEKTGRTIDYPLGRGNEIWRITEHCPIGAYVPARQEVDERPASLESQLEQLARTSGDLHVWAIGVYVTDPRKSCRVLAGCFPRELQHAMPSDTGSPGPAAGVSWGAVEDLPFAAPMFRTIGISSWVRINVPMAWSDGIEVLHLSHASSVSESAAALVAARMLKSLQPIWRAAADSVVKLTRRERECLAFALQGKTTRETAEALNITQGTVEFHLRQANERFEADGKMHAGYRALLLGAI